MAESTFNELCETLNRPALLAPSGTICALGGHPLDIVGETEIRVSDAGPITVMVTRFLPHEMLLGSDAIERGKGILDYEHETMTWYGKTYPLVRYCDGALDVGAVSVYQSTGHACIDAVLKKYCDVFSDCNPTLGHCDLQECTIDTGDSRPIRQRPYRTPLAKRKLIDELVDEMLEKGVITPIASPWSSPVTLAPKPDGSQRFCIDYRRLNHVTQKDRYPSVLIQDIFDQMSGSTIYTTIDLQSGFWQIPVAEKDIPKTAFACHRGQFAFLRMAFGLCNAPAIFQRTMDQVLQGLIGTCCFVYIDDIVIYSKTPQEHSHHLSQVLDRLGTAGLRAKTKKCHFARSEVPLLGYIVSKDGIRPNPDKTSAIAQMQPPTSVSEVRRFLGMCGYYRQALDNYAQVSEPLTELTRKFTRWKWKMKHESAFRTLQQMLLSDNVLAYPRVDQPYKLYTDASASCVGGILTQEDEKGMERVIQYVSHQLNTQEQKWATIEREAYAIVYCLKKLRPYLWGADFDILTDHKPLRALFLGEVANTRVQRWAVLIADFGAPIKYREGKHNIRADFMSRLPPPEIDVVDTTAFVEPQTDTVTWTLPLRFDDIDKSELSRNQESEFSDFWRQAADADDEEYQVQDGILFSCRRPGMKQAIYPRVLLPKRWREGVVKRCHEQTGHSGQWRTLCAVREAYVWPSMAKTVKDYVQACGVCQVHKANPQTAPYTRMPDPCYPFQIVSMDLCGPFTRSERGHCYLLNLVDHLSGWADSYPIGNKRGETIADILLRDYFPQRGPPEILISDNGTEFVNSSVQALCRACDVEHRTTTPYRPQSNAKVERFHRTLKGILSRLMSITNSNWEKQLGPALMAYRTTVSRATGYTPFQAVYGRQMRVPLTEALRTTIPNQSGLDDRVATLARVWHGAREALRQERSINEAQQRKKRLCGELQVGDLVIVLIPGMTRSFQPRWDARWQIMRVRHPVYWIRHLPSGREKVLHRDKLRWVPPDVDWQSTASEEVKETNDCQLALVPLESEPEPMETDDSLLEQLDVDQPVTTSIVLPSAIGSDASGSGGLPPVLPQETPTPPTDTSQPRYPVRKRRPPQYLAWEDWSSKRGRLAALDYYCYYYPQ